MVLLWVFTYDFTVGPLACKSASTFIGKDGLLTDLLDCIVGEVSSTRLRSKTVGLARNGYNVVGIVAGVLNTYMMNPLAVSSRGSHTDSANIPQWNWKGLAGFFWVSSLSVNRDSY